MVGEFKIYGVCPHGFSQTIHIAGDGSYIRIPQTCDHMKPENQAPKRLTFKQRMDARRFSRQLRKL